MCNKAVPKNTIIDRVLIPSNEGSHVFEVCNKRFCTKAKLNKHKWNHIGEKPYICKVCKK